jgi:hypothetical protein
MLHKMLGHPFNLLGMSSAQNEAYEHTERPGLDMWP